MGTSMEPIVNIELLKEWYYRMRLIRRFEERVHEKFIDGVIPGMLHLYIGEEATAVGVCSALNQDDYITSTHRGHGHTIAKGANVDRCMAELYGKRTGYCKGKGGSMHIADFSIGMLGANGIVGGGFPLATGAGLAIQLRKSTQVAVCFFGDGANNRGTFHECINMAAVWNLPVVFVCENNQWASTTALDEVSAVTDIAKRASAYNIPGVAVNGNDVFEVYEAAQAAIQRARSGKGPTLIECKTYRVKGHYVGDPEMYRTKDEVTVQVETNDPIMLFERKVSEQELLSQKEMDQIRQRVEQEIQDAIRFAEDSPWPAPEEAFEDVYAGEEAKG